LTNTTTLSELARLVKRKQALLESNLPGIAKHKMSGSADQHSLFALILAMPKENSKGLFLSMNNLNAHEK